VIYETSIRTIRIVHPPFTPQSGSRFGDSMAVHLYSRICCGLQVLLCTKSITRFPHPGLGLLEVRDVHVRENDGTEL